MARPDRGRALLGHPVQQEQQAGRGDLLRLPRAGHRWGAERLQDLDLRRDRGSHQPRQHHLRARRDQARGRRPGDRRALHPAPDQQRQVSGRARRRRDALPARRHVAAGPADHRRDGDVHAPDAGRGRQGDELRQVQGPAAQRAPAKGHLQGRRRHRGSPRRGRRDHRLPPRHPQVHACRRADPQGRAADGPARNRQDLARAGDRR